MQLKMHWRCLLVLLGNLRKIKMIGKVGVTYGPSWKIWGKSAEIDRNLGVIVGLKFNKITLRWPLGNLRTISVLENTGKSSTDIFQCPFSLHACLRWAYANVSTEDSLVKFSKQATRSWENFPFQSKVYLLTSLSNTSARLEFDHLSSVISTCNTWNRK